MSESYSKYFETLYDQPAPVGRFGSGTHYSVLRALCFQTPDLKPRTSASQHDFAVVWDGDHDRRIIAVLERLLFAGQLPAVKAIGERKGTITALISRESSRSLVHDMRSFQRELGLHAEVDGDAWAPEVAVFGEASTLINAPVEHAELYLRNIDLLWTLGSHDIELPSAERA